MSTLKTLIGKSDNFKGFLEFLLFGVSSSWMPHLNWSLKKNLGRYLFLFFFSSVLLVLLSLKLRGLKSAQYFTFPLSLHRKSACGVKSLSIGSGCPVQLCHVRGEICAPQSCSVLGLWWEKELHFCRCFGEGVGGTECAALFRTNVANSVYLQLC